IWGIPVMKTKGHARGARRVEGTGITDLRPLADSLDTYARQIHSIAEIVRVQLEMLEARSIEEESAEQSTEAKADENTAPCSPHAEFCSIGTTDLPFRSIMRVAGAACATIAASWPTATIRSPAIAMAWPIEKLASTVMTLAFLRMKSAG